MAIETLNVGTGPGTGDGDGLRSAQIKVNSNFAVSENAASKIVQASSADITADKVMMSDYAWRGAQLGDYFTYGGTANAITLTSANLKAGGTLIAGMKFRFKATLTNTGATTIAVDGGAATACVTPTGVALPAGFIRTDVITECEYDGSVFVVSRKIESGNNANGDWTKWEDGSASFCASKSETVNITASSGIGGFSGTGTNWSTPITFSQAPKITYGTSSVPMSVGSITVTATSYQTIYRNISSTASANVAFDAIGKGKWY